MFIAHTRNRSEALGDLANLRLFKEFSYINGEWVSQTGKNSLPVCDPADGTLLGTIPALTADHSRKAVDAAQNAPHILDGEAAAGAGGDFAQVVRFDP